MKASKKTAVCYPSNSGKGRPGRIKDISLRRKPVAFCPHFHEMQSTYHRMVGVERDLCGSSSPTPLLKQGHLQQAAQDLVQAGLEYLQRRSGKAGLLGLKEELRVKSSAGF